MKVWVSVILKKCTGFSKIPELVAHQFQAARSSSTTSILLSAVTERYQTLVPQFEKTTSWSVWVSGHCFDARFSAYSVRSPLTRQYSTTIEVTHSDEKETANSSLLTESPRTLCDGSNDLVDSTAFGELSPAAEFVSASKVSIRVSSGGGGFIESGLGEGSAMVGAAEEACIKQHRVGKKKGGPAKGLAEPTILREGEADILLHGNDVFYNKAQIVNRDLSLAVLRAFAAKHQEEHEISLANKATYRANNRETAAQNGKVNGQSEGEDASTSASRTIEDMDFKPPISESGVVPVEEGTEVEMTERNAETSAAPKVEAEEPLAAVEAVQESRTAKPLRVLEALAASGLRALRYAKEVDQVGSVVACDNDKGITRIDKLHVKVQSVAVEACERNIRLNGKVAVAKLTAHHADSRIYMLSHEKEFDVVDLDPYGSPSVFLDSAVQSISEGGLLMCTATDMAVLCGNNGEVCYSKYGAYPLRGKYCHEMALRILLASIESHATRYKRHIVPVLSLSVDFYVRVFVRIYTSASAIKQTPSKLSYVYQCVGCDSYHLQPVGRVQSRQGSTRYLPGTGPVIPPDCKQCGKHHNMGGPMWSAPIHDPEWIASMLINVRAMKTRYPAYEKVHSILTAVSEEIIDVPLYVSLHSMSATLKCTPPSSALFRSAVVNAGYRISGSHANPLGIKTDAPMEVLWDIMRCWVKGHPVKNHGGETPGKVILSKEPDIEVNFENVPGALSKALAAGVARFLRNPEFQPTFKAGRPLRSKHIASKQFRKSQSLTNSSNNFHISAHSVLSANFKKVQAAMSRALAAGVARFLPNPEEFWGPKPRAGRHLSSKHIASHGAAFVNGMLCAEGKPPIEDLINAAKEDSEAKRQKVGD